MARGKPEKSVAVRKPTQSTTGAPKTSVPVPKQQRKNTTEKPTLSIEDATASSEPACEWLHCPAVTCTTCVQYTHTLDRDYSVKTFSEMGQETLLRWGDGSVEFRMLLVFQYSADAIRSALAVTTGRKDDK